jgi:surfeit locus 1 family protein
MVVLGYSFTPKIWSIIVTAAFIFLFIELGNWQLSRADEKNAQQEKLDMLSKQPIIMLPNTRVKLDDFQYREVEIRGEYLPSHTIYLDNKTFKGVAGYHVLTPIRLANSSLHVLINRGWVAAGFDRSVLPDVPLVQGEMIVTGVVVSPEQRMLQLTDQVITGAVWNNLDVQRYQEITGLELQPILVLQQDQIEDGLVRQWDRPDSGSAKNMGYAIQWFSLAATAFIIFLVLNVKRKGSESK